MQLHEQESMCLVGYKEHAVGDYHVALPLGDPRRKLGYSNYNGCVPPPSWTVLISPENTIRCYEQDNVRFTDTKNS